MKRYRSSGLLASIVVMACSTPTASTTETTMVTMGNETTTSGESTAATTTAPTTGDPGTTDATTGSGTTSTGEPTSTSTSSGSTSSTGETTTTDATSSTTEPDTTTGPGVCGDGMIDAGEMCDDGNAIDTDECPSTCVTASCGDGFVLDGVELCDDGNAIDTDECPSTCEPATCGDKFVLAGVEECDDGNPYNSDFCTTACKPAECGDGHVQQGEACDDGNQVNDDGCTNACAPPSCGDGTLQDGEECDLGPLNDNSGACTSVCLAAKCGDGLVHTGSENCDTGGESMTCDANCTPVACGDGTINAAAGEACDDFNALAGDGCDPDCQPSDKALRVTTSGHTTCVLVEGGAVRCWGGAPSGALGDGQKTEARGDEPGEMPPPDVMINGLATDMSGAGRTCVLFAGGTMRCWGSNTYGQLGYGHTNDQGDEPGEMPTLLVNVGAPVKQVDVGGSATCVLTTAGKVRCWGYGFNGTLGTNDWDDLGSIPGDLPVADLPLPGEVIQISAGAQHVCALLQGGTVKCWGQNADGQLGQNHSVNIGDDPNEVPPSDSKVGGVVTQISAGGRHTCALLQGGTVRCWGYNQFGQLGYGHKNSLGKFENQMPTPDVNIGGVAVQVVAGSESTCVLLDNGEVRCWGVGPGVPFTDGILGDEAGEMPPPPVQLGKPAWRLGDKHATSKCVILIDKTVRCWGTNSAGSLGLGHTTQIGDDETPDSVGPVWF